MSWAVSRLCCSIGGRALAPSGASACTSVGPSAAGPERSRRAASGRAAVVPAGQAVESGAGFRIPDVLAQSGARLLEVGTTNRTYLQDYETAITPQTAAFLRVHPSNFQVIGFTAGVSLAELAGLGRERGLLVVDDLGSGCLLDTTPFGLSAEPKGQDSVAAGAGLVFFS